MCICRVMVFANITVDHYSPVWEYIVHMQSECLSISLSKYLQNNAGIYPCICTDVVFVNITLNLYSLIECNSLCRCTVIVPINISVSLYSMIQLYTCEYAESPYLSILLLVSIM